MEDKELWMNKLKEKLADYSEPVPASGWEQLEKELMLSVERKIYPYRKWMTAAAVILLAVAASVGLYYLGAPAADEMRYIQTPALVSAPDALPDVQQPDTKGMSVESLVRPATSDDRLAKLDNHNPEHLTMAEEPPVTVEDKQPAIEENESNTDQTQQEESKPATRYSPRHPSGRDKYHLPAEKKSSHKGTWSIGLAAGNPGVISSGADSDIPYMSRVSMSVLSNGLMEIPENQELVFEDGVAYLRQDKPIVDIQHHQPISFGLSVRKALPKGFSLETGLTYTLLSSDIQVAGDHQEVEQKLHYVGIPLRANWNFVDKKLVTLYVSGGGMVEKCVYGKLGSEKETVKPLQLSVSGSVGAQLNITKRVGIYAEPGVAYYFDDGSDVETIRKENPLNFNLQAGIRLTY